MSKSLQNILIKARKRTKECIIKAHKSNNIEDTINYLYVYRTLTKIIEGKPLNIFDLGEKSKN